MRSSYIKVERIPIESSSCGVLFSSNLLLLLERQLGDLEFVEACVFLGLRRDDMQQTALENGAVRVVICHDGLFWLFELDECEALSFAIALLQRNVYL